MMHQGRKTGWNEPGYFPDETWKEVVGADAPKGVLRSQIMPSIGERLPQSTRACGLYR